MTQVRIGEKRTKTARLLKSDDEAGTAKFIFAREGELDKDGDMFAPGSIRPEAEKIAMVSWQHSRNSLPVAAGTMSRDGNDVVADVLFLDTQAAQDTRAYLKAMGDSAQFSFGFRVHDYGFDDNVPGIIWKDVSVYELSPVFVGAGDTELIEVKEKAMPEDTKTVVEKNGMTEDERARLERLEKAEQDRIEAETAAQQKAERDAEIEKAVEEALAKARAENKNPARPVQVVWEDPSKELAKALFDTGEIQTALKEGRNTSHLVKGVGEMVKAVVTDAGSIQNAMPVAARQRMPTVLDASYIMPWPTEHYRNAVVERTRPAPLARGTGTLAGDSDVRLINRPLETIGSLQPLDKLTATSYPEVVARYAEVMFQDVRVQLDSQIIGGNGTSPNLTGLVNEITATAITQDGGSDRPILSDDAQGLYKQIADIRSTGMGDDANYIVASSTDMQKIYKTLTAQRSPFEGTQGAPYGAPMGAVVLLNSGLPANTIFVATLGTFQHHVVLVRDSVLVEIDFSNRFHQDQVVLKATVYAAAVVHNTGAFRRLTATNNFEAETA